MARIFKGYAGSLYGTYRQLKFTDAYDSVDKFLKDYKNNGLPITISDESVTTLYYLLYGRYGNDIIASSDINRFKYRLFSLIWQYAPTWEKKIEIQRKLRLLTEQDIIKGSRQIYNHATNPSTEPSTDSDDELAYINDQNVSKNQRGILEGYEALTMLLKNDVTQELLNRFQKLFLVVVQPEEPLLYIEEETDDEGTT